jgi:biotin carboxylase
MTAVDNLPVSVNAVVTVYENYVLATAWIAEHLGVPGLPINAAEACTDKFLMRNLFAKSSHKISPDFEIIESIDDIVAFAES